jgi:hypothetical protein
MHPLQSCSRTAAWLATGDAFEPARLSLRSHERGLRHFNVVIIILCARLLCVVPVLILDRAAVCRLHQQHAAQNCTAGGAHVNAW